jgi:hypothetical protein
MEADSAEDPAVSVIMPVYNGLKTIDRAISSVVRQDFAHWELVAIDDGSKDQSLERLRSWSEKDGRIRVLSSEKNRGIGVVRNEAIRQARGRMICYLDCDDEYHPNYLSEVVRLQMRADFLMFGYDYVRDEVQAQGPRTWDPIPFSHLFFEKNLTVPLGVAHSKELWEKVGGFNEAVWCQEDWEFWKRLARTGTDVLFVPLRSGIYHFHETNRSKAPNVTDLQREGFHESRRRAIASPVASTQARPRTSIKRVAFVSTLPRLGRLDPGLNVSLSMLEALSRHGFPCEAFLVDDLTQSPPIDVSELLRGMDLPFQEVDSRCGVLCERVTYTRFGGVAATLVGGKAQEHHSSVQAHWASHSGFFEKFLDAFRPGAVLTDGVPVELRLLTRLAKRWDIPIAVTLLDAPHPSPMAFYDIDYCLVNSEISKRHYWETLGLLCDLLPPVVVWDRVEARQRAARSVVFLDLQSDLGSKVLALLVHQLVRRQRDIHILVAESASGPSWRRWTDLTPSELHNVKTLTAARDPREIYGAARLAVSPWLGDLPLGLAVPEAMANGIPVLVSDCGPLPEIVGKSGLVLPAPARISPDLALTIDDHAIAAWVDAILRLWNDRLLCTQISGACARHAERWHVDVVGPVYADFFGSMHPQAGPPFIPK